MSEENNSYPEFTGDVSKHTSPQHQQEGNAETPKSGEKPKKKGGKKMKKMMKRTIYLNAELRIEKHKRKNDKKLYEVQLKCERAEGKLEAYDEILGPIKRYLQQEPSRLLSGEKVIDVNQYSVNDEE